MASKNSNISRNFIVEQPYNETDIGGTNLATATGDEGWTSLGTSQKILVRVNIVAWDAADNLTTLQLEEATDIYGTSSALITGKTITLTTANIASGDVYILEASGSDLTTNFNHVRVYAATTDNTGPDTLSVTYIKDKNSMVLSQSDAEI